VISDELFKLNENILNEKANKSKALQGENVKNKTDKFEKINEALRLKKANAELNKNKIGMISDEIDDDEDNSESFEGSMEMKSVEMPMTKEEEYLYLKNDLVQKTDKFKLLLENYLLVSRKLLDDSTGKVKLPKKEKQQ